MAVGTIVLTESGSLSFHIADGKLSKELEQPRFYACFPEMILLAVECADLMIYDIEIPGGVERKNIELVLNNELSYLLPLNFDEVCWGYKQNSENHFSVCVLKKERFDSILTIVSQNSLFCDVICPVLPETLPDDLRKFVPVTLTIPKENRPVRNKTSRILYFLLLLISVTMCGFIFWSKYSTFQKEYTVLKSATADKNRQFKQIQSDFGKLSTEKELLDQIKGLNLKMNSLLPLLHELNTMLPKHMWITNYVQHGNTIDLTIQSSQDEPNFYRHLSQAKSFKIVNLRKSRGGNSTVIFYVKLQGGVQ